MLWCSSWCHLSEEEVAGCFGVLSCGFYVRIFYAGAIGWSNSLILDCDITVKPVLGGHSKIEKNKDRKDKW